MLLDIPPPPLIVRKDTTQESKTPDVLVSQEQRCNPDVKRTLSIIKQKIEDSVDANSLIFKIAHAIDDLIIVRKDGCSAGAILVLNGLIESFRTQLESLRANPTKENYEDTKPFLVQLLAETIEK